MSIRAVRRTPALAALGVAVAVILGLLIAPTAQAVRTCTPAPIPAERIAEWATCDLTGWIVRLPDGIRMRVPERGMTVGLADAIASERAVRDIEVVQSSRGGVAVVLDERVVGATDPLTAQDAVEEIRPALATAAASIRTASTVGCGRSEPYETYGSWPSKTFTWRYNTLGEPSTASQSKLGGAAATLRIGRSTTCGDLSNGLEIVYAGRTSARPATTAGGCLAACDGRNVVGWGPLGEDILGRTCYWRQYGTDLVETDIILDTSNRQWHVSGTRCVGVRADLQGVATHEFGHAVGLSHVAAGEDQVMRPRIDACDFGWRQLGRGDQNGLRALYGR